MDRCILKMFAHYFSTLFRSERRYASLLHLRAWNLGSLGPSFSQTWKHNWIFMQHHLWLQAGRAQVFGGLKFSFFSHAGNEQCLMCPGTHHHASSSIKEPVDIITVRLAPFLSSFRFRPDTRQVFHHLALLFETGRNLNIRYSCFIS